MKESEQNSQLLLQDTPIAERKGVPLVFSWGRNEDGQLAIPTNKFTNQPTAIRGFKGIVKEIASARTHTAILNHQGQIYMAGSLLFGKIGIPSQLNNFREFRLHELMLQFKVKKVACGDFHTLALTEQGALYSWGGSLWDKTGHKGGGILKIERLAGQQIIDIACGDFHSIALSSDGQVYSWGGGGQNKNKGQLGHGNKKDYPHPQLIQFFKGKKAKKIACGDYHTMVLTKDEQLFAFGEGNYGQLGTGVKDDTATPKKVVLSFQTQIQKYFTSGLNQQTRVEQMALGGKHSLIRTNKGHLYVCGFGGQGQLGLGITQNQFEPVLIQSLLGKQIKMVAAGVNHSICVTDRGDIYCCGYNAKGQLGLGVDKFITNWTHVTELQGSKVSKVFAGGDHSWCVLDQYQPYIDDYTPPSPIRLNVQSSSFPKPVPQQPPKRRGEETILQPSTNKKLELILTEVQMSHRFIHFVLKDKLIKNSQAQINNYIQTIKKIEGDHLKFYKLNQDGEVYDSNGQLTLAGNPKGMTIMLVCELPESATEHFAYSSKNKIAIGDLIMMDSHMLKIDGKIPSHNMWFFKFISMFEHELEKVRFVELRPKRQ